MKTKKQRRWLPLVLGVALSMLSACDGPHSAEGITWQHPDNDALPFGFSDSEEVPAYVKRWRMPHGFAGFRERWNKKVHEHLEKELKGRQKEFCESMQRYLLSSPGSEAHRRALVQVRAEKMALEMVARRLVSGDYLVFRRPKDLPDDLDWQKGDDEPELGSPKAVKGGTLRLALNRSFPNTLRAFGPNSNNATRRYIYDDIDIPLVRIHPGTGRLIPGTADRWAVSKDGRTVYFHIDEKATFSDGSPLTSRDFITSLFVRTSPYAQEPFYHHYFIGNFERITVYSNQDFAVTLTHARPYAPYYAALPSACTPFYAEFGPDFTTRYLWRVAPTTGAYAMLPGDLVMGRSMVLSRVKNWWAADRRYTRYSCNVDQIKYSFIAEETKIKELFRIGRLDVISARNPDAWYEGMEIDPVYRGLIQRVHFSNIWPRNCFGWHLNCAMPPFDDINVRKGFHHAMNVQLIIDTVFRGDYSRSGSYFAGFGAYTDEGLKPLPYSPEKARAYFAKAGYTKEDTDGVLCRPDGQRLQVVVSSRIDPLNAACMGRLREEALRCGLDLQLAQMDDTVFYRSVKEKKHEAALFSWGFSPPLPDPSFFFQSRDAFMEDGSPRPGTNNITATASAELDRAILDCRMAATESEAVAAHHQTQHLIARSASWVPGWHASFWRFAQWRWLCWPDTPECRFCPPRYYDPLDSHLYWIDEKLKEETLDAKASGKRFPERQIEVPLPPTES